MSCVINASSTNGLTLTSDLSGQLQFANNGVNLPMGGVAPAFSAYAGASQTIATGTWTKVVINTKEFDTANAFDSTTNYRFTPLVPGYYQVSGQATITTAGSNAIVAVYKNGTSYKRGSMTSTNTFSSGNSLSALVFLNGSTDYIELYMIHNLGINATLSFGSDLCFFQACLVRGA